MENTEQNQQNTNQEGEQNQKVNDSFQRFMEHPNFKLVADLVSQFLNNNAASTKLNYKGILFERGYMLFTTALSLGAIIALSTYDVIDKTSSGTLIGTVIGYAMAKRIDENR